MISIDQFEAFCFDLDGTIFLGNERLLGAKEVIEHLRFLNKKILFITNSPTLTRKECLQKLRSLEIRADIEEIITASFVSAMYLLNYFPDSRVFIVGEKAMEQELDLFSIRMTEDPEEASHVLVGLDRSFTYEKLNLAMVAVRNGAKLLVTNPDPFCPVPGGVIADTYAIARAIEVASGQPIFEIIGKPSHFYGEVMMEKLEITSDKCLIIGDRLETDIMLGKRHHFYTCLVLTGASTLDEIEEKKIYPDYIIQDLQLLLKHMKE